ETPGRDVTYAGDNDTYSNPFRMPNGRIYNFFRGVNHDPNYMYSDDEGATWKYGGRWLYGRTGYSPYLKYASDGKGTVHFVTTEDHPRNFDNSLYHGYLRDGMLYQSDGKVVGPLNTTTEAKIATWDFTKVFQGTPDNVAWMVDIRLDKDDRPYVLFSTQVDGRGLPRGQGGLDLRYHYARWDGRAWQEQEIAHAGTRLYPGADDSSGLGAVEPRERSEGSRRVVHIDRRRPRQRRAARERSRPPAALRALPRQPVRRPGPGGRGPRSELDVDADHAQLHHG